MFQWLKTNRLTVDSNSNFQNNNIDMLVMTTWSPLPDSDQGGLWNSGSITYPNINGKILVSLCVVFLDRCDQTWNAYWSEDMIWQANKHTCKQTQAYMCALTASHIQGQAASAATLCGLLGANSPQTSGPISTSRTQQKIAASILGTSTIFRCW